MQKPLKNLTVVFSPVARRVRFASSKASWAKARRDPPPPWNPQAEEFSAEEIPRPYKDLADASLLAVYDLLSRGRFFFNTKAEHVESEEPMCSLRLWYPYMGEAMRMCNVLFPRRLLSFLGPLVAEQTTYCFSRELGVERRSSVDLYVFQLSQLTV
jgi:hypothetical protein